MITDIETTRILRESFERYCADHYDFLQRSKRLQLPGGYCAHTWQSFAEFGWLSTCLPEDFDGLQGDAHAVAALSEVTGAQMVLEPFLACAVVAPNILVQVADPEILAQVLHEIASGALKIVLTQDHGLTDCRLSESGLNGEQLAVLHADVAERFLVPVLSAANELCLALVGANQPGVTRQAYRLVDGRGAAHVQFNNVQAQLLCRNASTVQHALQHAQNIATAALCAEDKAIAQQLLALTNEYLKVRHQFGKPLASNQALQHRMADLYLLSKEAQALSMCANQTLELEEPDARVLSGARAYSINAARRVASEAIQMHGGVGITEELKISHYFRRLMVNATQFGNRQMHFDRFAQLTLSATGEEHV